MKKHPYSHVTRMAALCAIAALGQASLNAQTQASDESTGASTSASPVVMSAFEVTTTQGHGYASTNAAAGFKTDESLMDIPQADIVVTQDFIKDIGYSCTTDVLRYFGLAAGFEGEASELRGASVGYAYIDGMPVHQSYMDNGFVDSYEVIKGPTQALYLNAPLQGLVIKNSKQPLPFVQDTLTASYDQYGLYRFTLDFTGPVGMVGDTKLSYRLVGIEQAGQTYFQNVKNNWAVIYPVLKAVYHNTTVRLSYNAQRGLNQTGQENLLTPSGDLYTGAGRRSSNEPPNNMVDRNNYFTELVVDQKISDTWENRVTAIDQKEVVYGSSIGVNDYDWALQEETFLPDRYDQIWKYWSVLDDTVGKYAVGPSNWEMNCVDTFGYGFTSWTNEGLYWTSVPFPYPNGPVNGTVTVPFNSQAAINSIVIPPNSAYIPPANEGDMFETVISSIYFQHSMDIVPKWLTVSAGFTWDNVSTTSIPNVSTLPWNGTVVSVSDWVHRLGAVLHLTQNVSVYALDSTSFTPPGSGTILENGLLPPVTIGTGTELGLKWNFLGGRISGEAAWFKMTTSNNDVIGGELLNGLTYVVPIGSAVEEGVDGDASFLILPGWQAIGTWYAGHKSTSASSYPVAGTYNNSWSLFTRYDFPKDSVLRGLDVGAGVSRIGSFWADDSGLIDVPGGLPASGVIKMHPGTLVDAFVTYEINKHLAVKVTCNNVLDETYPVAAQAAYYIDPSIPTDFVFQVSYRF